MLFGYIFDIVKDAQIAEQYLVHIYNNLPKNFNELYADDCNIWCQLQRLAKKQLSAYFDSAKTGYGISEEELKVYHARNKYIALMSGEQQQVFCSIYYRGKTTAQLSKQLNKGEDVIRKTLKEAFAIIKRA